MLTAEQIRASGPGQVKKVPIPEWGGEVCVRQMSGDERDTLDALLEQARAGKRVNLRGWVAATCLCDESGKRLFEEHDAALLGGKNGAAIQRLFEAAIEHNKVDRKAVDEAEKN